MFVKGTGEETIVRHDAEGLEDLTVDWISREIYWLDRISKHLDVAELYGRDRKTILGQGVYDLRVLMVIPEVVYLLSFLQIGHLQVS